jgi:hypothetical protein
MPDHVREYIQECPGGDRWRAGQVPHLADGPRVGAQGAQSSSNVGNVAIAVKQLRITDEIDLSTGQRVGEDTLANRRAGHAGTEEVRRPPNCDLDLPCRRGCLEFLRHRSPGAPFDSRRGKR